MSDLTYTGRTYGPGGQATRLAAWRDQDAPVLRRGQGGGRVPAVPPPTGRDLAHAAGPAHAEPRAAVPRTADQGCGPRVANRVSRRRRCDRDRRGVREDHADDARVGDRRLPAAAQTVRRPGVGGADPHAEGKEGPSRARRMARRNRG